MRCMQTPLQQSSAGRNFKAFRKIWPQGHDQVRPKIGYAPAAYSDTAVDAEAFLRCSFSPFPPPKSDLAFLELVTVGSVHVRHSLGQPTCTQPRLFLVNHLSWMQLCEGCLTQVLVSTGASVSAAVATGLLMSFSMPEWRAKSLLHRREAHPEHVHHAIDMEGSCSQWPGSCVNVQFQWLKNLMRRADSCASYWCKCIMQDKS